MTPTTTGHRVATVPDRGLVFTSTVCRRAGRPWRAHAAGRSADGGGPALDLSGLGGSPSALALVPVVAVAPVVVRGVPGFALDRDLSGREVVAAALRQPATSLPFLLTVGQIGIEMVLLDPATGAGLVAAILMSVLVCAAALAPLWSPRVDAPATAAARAVPAEGVRSPRAFDLDRLPNG